MATEITAKNVRTLAPGGGVANFMGITGNSHKYFWLSTDLIALMLSREIKVYERLAPTEVQDTDEEGTPLWQWTSEETGGSGIVASDEEPVAGEDDIPEDAVIEPVMVMTEEGEVELTTENYDQDNGGEELDEDSDVVVIQDLEGERQAQHDAEKADYLTELGLIIKARQDAMAGGDEEEDVETGTEESPTLSGSSEDVTEGNEFDDTDTVVGGSGTDTVTVTGGSDTDTVVGGSGTDTVTVTGGDSLGGGE